MYCIGTYREYIGIGVLYCILEGISGGTIGKTRGVEKWKVRAGWAWADGGSGLVYEKGRFLGSENDDARAAGTATPSTTLYMTLNSWGVSKPPEFTNFWSIDFFLLAFYGSHTVFFKFADPSSIGYSSDHLSKLVLSDRKKKKWAEKCFS